MTTADSTAQHHRAEARANWPGLVRTLIRTDFKARYYGSLSGFCWALLKPLVMFFALISVFSFVFRSEQLYRDNLLIGLFLWEFFSEATKTGLGSLNAKGFVLTKVRFPAWILVVTSISNALITVVVFWLAMIAYLYATGRTLALVNVLLSLGYLSSFAVIAIGISLASSVLFLRYRDLNQVWDVAMQAGFFITPIIWPLGTVPERYHFLLYFWPPTPIIEFTRSVLLSSSYPTLTAHLYLGLETLAVFGIGVIFYRRLAPRAAEYL